MSTGEQKFTTVRLRKAPPLVVYLGPERWTITLSYYGKGGGRAELLATSAGGRSGSFLSGRAEVVESAARIGLHVPHGTVRYRLALALVAAGYAAIVNNPAADGW